MTNYNTDVLKKSSLRSELQGLKGGSKQFWLRTHRKEVEAFYFHHGPEATMKEFNMCPTTLEAFLKRKASDDKINKLSEADRWVLRMSKADVAEVRKRVNDLEDWKESVTPIIEVGRALVNATMGDFQAKVRIPALSGEHTSLSDFAGSQEIERQ